MSPSTVPDIWMFPVVFILPLMCKSVDRVDDGGFAFGTDNAGFNEEDGDRDAFRGFSEAVLGMFDGFGCSGFLENIVCRLHIAACI